MGSTVHLRAISAFAWGLAIAWLPIMSRVCSNQYRDVRFSTCPLNGIAPSRRSKPLCRSVVTNSRRLSLISYVSRTLPTYFLVRDFAVNGRSVAVRQCGIAASSNCRSISIHPAKTYSGYICQYAPQLPDAQRGKASNRSRQLALQPWRPNQHQSNAHVERAVHLEIVDISQLLHQRKDRLRRPRRTIDHNTYAFRQNARHILHQSAAGNMRHALHRNPGTEKVLHRSNMVGMGREQCIHYRFSLKLLRPPIDTIAAYFEDQL